MASKKILHRDIKLENIVFKKIEDYNTLKIIDFGLAEIGEKSFALCGTPGYIAPELFRSTADKPYDSKCDVFSAGVILHKLLFKKHIFHGNNSEEVLENNKKGIYDQSLLIQSKLPKETIDLLKKMLEFDNEKRISAAEALNHPYFNKSL